MESILSRITSQYESFILQPSIFVIACFTGDVTTVKRLRNGVGQNHIGNGFGLACSSGQLEVVKLLLPGVSNNPDEIRSGLRQACLRKHVHVIDYMMSMDSIVYSDDISQILGAVGDISLAQRYLDKFPSQKYKCFYGAAGVGQTELGLELLKTMEISPHDVPALFLRSAQGGSIALVKKFQRGRTMNTLQEGLEKAIENGHSQLAAYFINKGITVSVLRCQKPYSIYRLVKDKERYIAMIPLDDYLHIRKLETIKMDMAQYLPISSDLVENVYAMLYPV